jgi:microtubule-associated protein-like 6
LQVTIYHFEFRCFTSFYCSGYEILFSDANNGAQITDGATKLLETEWQTWSLTLGWPVIGIWSGSMDGTDINNVDRSPSGKYLATCDDFGKVNLYNWPALREKGSQHSAFTGHSSHVTCLKWLSALTASEKKQSFKKIKTDDFLISIGGEDKCVFQWKHRIPEEEKQSKASFAQEQISEGSDKVDVEDIDIDLPTGGDEFMAVKPWLGAIVAPTAWNSPDSNKISSFYASLGEFSNHFRKLTEMKEENESNVRFNLLKQAPNIYQDLNNSSENVIKKLYESGINDSSPPNADELELEFIYGYRGFDCRNNLFYVTLPANNGRFILYYAAALGILYDCKKRKQTYFRGHNDDVLSMAVCEVKHQNNATVEQVLVATGQIGMGNIFVWEVPSMQTLSVLTTKQKTVLFLAFSQNGRFLVSMGEDKSLTVSDWKNQSTVVTTKMDANTLLHVCPVNSASAAANPSGAFQFFTTGDKLLKLWTVNGRNVTSNKCVTSKLTKLQNFFCVVEVAGKFLIGCEDGKIYLGDGKTVLDSFPTEEKAVPEGGEGKKKAANPSSVTAMCTYFGNEIPLVVSGGKDGSIIFWDVSNVTNPQVKFRFSIDSVFSDVVGKQIQSLCVRPSSTANTLLLLVGTRGCDILEVEINLSEKRAVLYQDGITDGIIMRSHFNEELWGLATHPFLPEFVTVGDDKTLRIYHLHSRKQLFMTQLGLFARSCCYSADGTLLAVGFGGRVGKGKEQGDGTVRLYSISEAGKDRNVTKLSERRDAKQWISDIKFSNDGRTVVAGAHDCKIYIYNVVERKELSLKTVFTKHNAVINHLDLSVDSRFMQSNCAGYELLFSDITTGKQITNPNEVKDVKWQSWTCTLGWPVQGIWGAEMKGSDINAVARSHTGHLLATSDDSGKVHLFRYPVMDTNKKGEKSLQFSGHSSHIMNIKFTAGDEYLISVGGNDKCIFQWKHTMTEPNSSNQSQSSKSEKRDRALPAVQEEKDFGEESSSGKASSMDDLLSMELGGGDESLSVKPWVGAVRPPKNPPPVNEKPPTIKVNLSWIHGYSSTGISHRQNVFYTNSDDIVYPTAALAVCLKRPPNSTNNPAEWKQSYFTGHDDDVLCCAMSFNRRFLVTGQIASKKLKGKASVIVWDALQARSLSKMEGCHGRGVSAVAFNQDSSLLISVGMDDNCTHILWSDVGGNWSRVQQIASVKGDRQATNFLQFLHPKHPMAEQNEYHFIEGNQKTLNLWKIEGSNLTKKAAKLGKKCPQVTTFLSTAQILSVSTYQTIIGNNTGDLLILEGRELNTGTEKAHEGGIYALSSNDSKSLLISGGKDGKIHLWSSSLQMMHTFALPTIYSQFSSLPLFDPTIIALSFKGSTVSSSASESGEKLNFLVGTSGGTLVELSIPVVIKGSKGTNNNNAAPTSSSDQSLSYDFDKASLAPVIYSHFRGELWGLGTHPFDADLYATVGDDSILRVWSIKRNCCLASKKLTRPARTLAWHPLGSLIAVGLVSPEEMNRKAGGKGGGQKKGGKGAATSSKTEAKEEGNEDPLGLAENDENVGGKASDMNENAMVLLFAFQTTSPQAAELKFVASGALPYDPTNSAIVIDGTKNKSTSTVSIFSISDIKFTPNGKCLLTGGHDCKIHGFRLPTVLSGNILNISPSVWEEWERALKLPSFIFNKHTSGVTHFDCSNDSNFIQSNDIGNELLFYDLAKCKQEPSASKLADYNNHHIFNEEETVGKDFEGEAEGGSKLWASQTCIFGWSVQGIWPATAYDSSEINSVDRHVSMKFLATSEDSGIIRILRFPTVVPNSQSISLTGHSSHVTACRWTIGNHLISVGGNDKSVFVWQFEEK